MSQEKFKKAIEERRLGFVMVSDELVRDAGSLISQAFYDILLTSTVPYQGNGFVIYKYFGYSDKFDRLGKIENVPEYSCHTSSGRCLFQGETEGVELWVLGVHTVFERIKNYDWVTVTDAPQT